MKYASVNIHSRAAHVESSILHMNTQINYLQLFPCIEHFILGQLIQIELQNQIYITASEKCVIEEINNAQTNK